MAKASTVMIEEQGVPKDKHTYKYQADLRYIGQAISIPIEIEESSLKTDAIKYISELFEVAHEKAFTYRLTSNIELVNLRIVVLEITPEFAVRKVEATKISEPAAEAVSGKTKFVYQSCVHEDTPIWDRSMLKCGHVVKGPAIISEMDSNTVILPGYKAEIDHVGNILIWEAKTVTNGITSAVSGAVNEIAHTVNGFTNGLTNGVANGVTNGRANGVTKDEPLDMVTGLLS